MVDIVWPRTSDALVWSPLAIPRAERNAQLGEVVEATNQRHTTEPLVLETLEKSLRDRNRTMAAHGPSSVLDAMVLDESREAGASEHCAFVGHEMCGTTMKLERGLQRRYDRGGVGVLQWNQGRLFAREMINRGEYFGAPEDPGAERGEVRAPDVIRVVGTDVLRRLWLGLCIRRLGLRAGV